MMKALRKRWLFLGGVFGAGVGAVVVSAFAIFAGAGIAAGQAKPVNTSPPTISGTPQVGKTLTGDKGTWTNNPTDFTLYWFRCGPYGGNCINLYAARGSKTYTLVSLDVGKTIRFEVRAKNADGVTIANSAQTAVVTAAPAPPPSRGNGCPPGGNPDQVGNITAPASLILDALTSDPSVVTGGVGTLVVRFHVTSTCGGPVQGALVYATATPFNQFSIPPEVPTGADGWAELRFQRLSGFPVSPRQQLIAMFARARKPGESLLAGIAARRLVSLRVNLHG